MNFRRYFIRRKPPSLSTVGADRSSPTGSQFPDLYGREICFPNEISRRLANQPQSIELRVRKFVVTRFSSRTRPRKSNFQSKVFNRMLPGCHKKRGKKMLCRHLEILYVHGIHRNLLRQIFSIFVVSWFNFVKRGKKFFFSNRIQTFDSRCKYIGAGQREEKWEKLYANRR